MFPYSLASLTFQMLELRTLLASEGRLRFLIALIGEIYTYLVVERNIF